MFRVSFSFILLLFLTSCVDKLDTPSSTIFFAVQNMDSTGVKFYNPITENDTLNYFNFPYLYLGGGVSIGDINNDGLPDIYFTGNLVPNKLYLNKGDFTFKDISEKAGVSGDKRWYTGSTMADVNNDGYLDIYVNVSEYTGNGANQLFINNGDGTFTEKAESYGIADKSTSIQSTFFDYDNDGLLDLFVANYPIVQVSMGNQYYYKKMVENHFKDSGHLYKNNGDQTFTNVTTEAGVQNFGLTLGLIATDFNNDGYKDLYLSNDFNVPDYLYQNNGDGTFSEISKKAMRHTAMFGMGIDSGDLNNDGLMDFLQVDMTAEDYKRSKTNMASMSPETFYEAVDLGFNHQYMQNALQLNQGNNTDNIPLFSDISRYTGMSTTDWSWGPVFADFNNDGWQDIFITNGVKRDVNNNDVNQKYTADNVFGKDSKRDFKLLPSTPISNFAFKNNGDYTFSQVTQKWGLQAKGFSNGAAYADLDRDGDLDLVINNLDKVASIYKNETSKKNYLRVRLIGGKKNPFGIGAKVIVKTKDLEQTQELTLTRGYQSSTEPILHFGIGDYTVIDEIKIIWNTQFEQVLTNIPTNQLIHVSIEDALEITKKTAKEGKKFLDITKQSGISFKHTEDSYDDFAIEPLLPHKNSNVGPGLAVGDVNADGLEDFFIGNASGEKASLYLQNKKGTFDILKGPWENESFFEDTGALLFDVDGDNDLDLYIVSGGNNNNFKQELFQDRLYLNTANGFIKSKGVLPKISSSGKVIKPCDFDRDGDIDLFVGGRIVAGKYPYPAKSYILRNNGGKDDKLKYMDITDSVAADLDKAGLVTSAIWDDFDGDDRIDLILTGEWMPIRFLKNTVNGFIEVTDDLRLQDSKGWWYSLEKIDLDNDGDMDYLLGNLGLNYKYRTSVENPFEVYANDFDENGTTDIVLSYKKQGKKLPLRGRECSSEQVPLIKRRFETFKSFADADLNEIYGEQMLKKALHYKANTFAHHWIEKKGKGSFELHKLPNQTQFSSINTFQVFDYNNDDYPDVLFGGNLYESEIETPRNDSGLGGVLLGGNQNELEYIESKNSGLFLDGEVKEIKSIKLGKNGRIGFLVAANNRSLKLLILKNN